MSRLQELHPDQQAVLQLVLRRRMAYADIGATLGLEPAQVRERALDAVDGLAPDDVPGLELEDRDRLADLLLGQGDDDARAATRELLYVHAPARTWAARVAAELAPLGGPAEGVPEAGDGAPAGDGLAGGPAAADDAPPAPGTPADDPQAQAAGAAAAATPVASGGSGDVREAFAALEGERPARVGREHRAGGGRPSGRVLAAGALALVVAALILAWVGGLFDGDDEPSADASSPPAATTTGTSGAAQDQADATAFLAALPRQINFRPPVGAQAPFSNVKGVAQSTLSQTTGEPVLALTTEGVPKATSARRYFAWADKSGQDPILIGQLTDARGAELPFTGVDLKTRKAAAVDPAVYNRIRITRQGAKAPTKPGPTVLVGTLRLRSGS